MIGRDLIKVIPEWSSGFPYFLQFQSEFGNNEFMIWATVSSWSCFCWLYRASPSSAAKNIINLILILTIWWCPCIESYLVLLEEGIGNDQYVLLAKLYSPLPCFILYSKARFACISLLPTFAFQSSIMKRTSLRGISFRRSYRSSSNCSTSASSALLVGA